MNKLLTRKSKRDSVLNNNKLRKKLKDRELLTKRNRNALESSKKRQLLSKKDSELSKKKLLNKRD